MPKKVGDKHHNELNHDKQHHAATPTPTLCQAPALDVSGGHAECRTLDISSAFAPPIPIPITVIRCHSASLRLNAACLDMDRSATRNSPVYQARKAARWWWALGFADWCGADVGATTRQGQARPGGDGDCGALVAECSMARGTLREIGRTWGKPHTPKQAKFIISGKNKTCHIISFNVSYHSYRIVLI